MGYPRSVKETVRRYYVEEGRSLTEAAQRAAVSRDTVRRWRRQAKSRGDDWEAARHGEHLAGCRCNEITTQLIGDFVLLFRNTLDEVLADQTAPAAKAAILQRLAVTYIDTMKAAWGAAPEVSRTALGLELMAELIGHIHTHHPGDLERFVGILKGFVEQKTQPS